MSALAHKTLIDSSSKAIASLSSEFTELNIFSSEHNFNVAISSAEGYCGPGFMFKLIAEYYDKSQIFMLQPFTTYVETRQLLNGEYIAPGTSNKHLCLNPFSFKSWSVNFGLLPLANVPLKLRTTPELWKYEELMLQILLITVDIADDGSIPAAEAKQYFKRALLISLMNNRMYSSYTTIYNELIKLAIADNNSFIKSLAELLLPYTSSGSLAKYFEGECNLNLSNKFTLIDLEAFYRNPQLRNLMFSITLQQIVHRMKHSNQSVPKLCIIDDMDQQLLNHPVTSRFIENIYRMVPELNGGFVTIRPSLDDYASEPATTCYQLSTVKVLLGQRLPRKLKLSSQLEVLFAKAQAKHREYADCIIEINQQATIQRFNFDDEFKQMFSLLIKPTPEELIIFTAIRHNEKLGLLASIQRLQQIQHAYAAKYFLEPEYAEDTEINYRIAISLQQHTTECNYQDLIRSLGLTI